MKKLWLVVVYLMLFVGVSVAQEVQVSEILKYAKTYDFSFLMCNDTVFNSADVEKATQLEQLGFKVASNNLKQRIEIFKKLSKITEYEYLCFDNKDIGTFLNQLPTINPYILYSSFVSNNAIGYDNATWQLPDGQIIVIKFNKSKTEELRKPEIIDKNGYAWIETPIDQYKEIPTKEVLGSLEKAQSRNIFDYFTIATIEKSKDPMLLGRIEGSDKRFFIGLW